MHMGWDGKVNSQIDSLFGVKECVHAQKQTGVSCGIIFTGMWTDNEESHMCNICGHVINSAKNEERR